MAADLADVEHKRKEHNNIGYLAVCRDVFSTHTQVVPCRNEDPNTKLLAIKKWWKIKLLKADGD